MDESPSFFKEHGIFYQASATIGRLIEDIQPGEDSLEDFKSALLKDPVSKTWLVYRLLLTFSSVLNKSSNPSLTNPPNSITPLVVTRGITSPLY